MKKAATITALLAIIATCMVVVFRNYTAGQDDGYVSARERAIIKKFDQDGDGQLNWEEERAAKVALKASEDRRQEYIKKFDQNGDGQLNREEREAARAATKADRAAIIKKFDADGDGKLGEEEGLAARAALGR